MIEQGLLAYLKKHPRKKIKLTELECAVSPDTSYTAYALVILDFIDKGFLKPAGTLGTNHRDPDLPNVFHIVRKELEKDFFHELEKYAMKMSQYLSLDYYFNNSETVWRKEKDAVMALYEYLDKSGYPTYEASSQERSYEICGDEKWLDFKGGHQILSHLNIKEKMQIKTQSEPAMFALNPKQFRDSMHRHLIVENKATYYRLLDILPSSNFSTLIYGAGWRVISSMKDFERQYPVNGTHQYYYFGDVDFEGLKILNSLSDMIQLKPAKSFYLQLTQEDASKGKENQKRDLDVLKWFSNEMPECTDRIQLLLEGMYWPQEALGIQKLKNAWEQLYGD